MSTTDAPARARALSDFIQRLVAELEPLHRRHNEATWLANVTGAEEHEQESARLEVEIRRLYSSAEGWAFLRETQAGGGVDEPLLARQLALLHDDFRVHQIPPAAIERMVKIEKSLESRFNRFRAILDGAPVTDNAIRDVLRDSDDGARRRSAWEAGKQIGAEVSGDLLELVRMRNQAARDIGFPNYYSMTLATDELDEDELFGLLDDLDRRTRPLFQRYKDELDARLVRRFGVERDALRPWHYGDPFFQEAPAADVRIDPWFEGRRLEDIAERFFDAVGFPIGELLQRADLYEKPGKSQHAFCLSIDRGKDIRILCNLRSNEYWMGTLLHEVGHAVYDASIDRSLPYLLRVPAHILATEASAMLFGRMSKNAAWLSTWAGAPREEAERVAARLAAATRSQLLVQARWNLVMCHMERALYRDPAQDLDALWWDLVERFQWVRRPDGRRAPDWASKIHFSVAPVYYHNYLLGEIMASQLQAHLLERVLGGGPGAWDRMVTRPEVGAFLVEALYRAGRSMDWRRTLQRAVGQSLSPAAFVSDMTDPTLADAN